MLRSNGQLPRVCGGERHAARLAPLSQTPPAYALLDLAIVYEVVPSQVMAVAMAKLGCPLILTSLTVASYRWV